MWKNISWFSFDILSSAQVYFYALRKLITPTKGVNLIMKLQYFQSFLSKNITTIIKYQAIKLGKQKENKSIIGFF